MTTPTPCRPSSSKFRTTRPRQSSCTSVSAPITSAGSEIVKSTIEPTGISASTSNNTPLAEIFCVSADRRPVSDFSATGSFSGKRAALCMSLYCFRPLVFSSISLSPVFPESPGDKSFFLEPSFSWSYLDIRPQLTPRNQACKVTEVMEPEQPKQSRSGTYG